MSRRARILTVLWGLWGAVCLVSFGLEIQSPFYSDALAWVYWGPESELGWRSSSLLRWVLFHLLLFIVPACCCAAAPRRG